MNEKQKAIVTLISLYFGEEAAQIAENRIWQGRTEDAMLLLAETYLDVYSK